MNKKCSLLLLIVLVLGISPVYGETNYDIIKLKEGVAPYGNHAFNDGLIPVMYDGSISENGNWAYLTEEGNLFSNKYASGFEYSEGLVPIVKEIVNGDNIYLKLGYMNRRGKIVIEPIYDVYSSSGITFAGRFINGEALVFKYDESKKESHSIPGYWYRIDKEGKRINKDEIVETKDLLFGDNEKTKRIYNDKYSVNYDTEETVSIYGKTISKVRFSKDKAVVRIEDGDKKGSYIISKKTANKDKLSAKRSKQKVLMNGKSKDIDAYLINGNNYFKLRDVAYILNATEKQFDVKWNSDVKDIDIYSDKAYTIVGGEMQVLGKDVEKPIRTTSSVYLDGSHVKLESYKIAGNNYFKLRDLGRLIDFGVEWDSPTNTVKINTTSGYRE